MLKIEKPIIAFDYTGAEAEEILRNLTTLYGTHAGSVPLDRELGLDQEFTGYPIAVAENMIALEITEKTEIYEPRAEVEEVTFQSVPDKGLIIPTVRITRSEADGIEGEGE